VALTGEDPTVFFDCNATVGRPATPTFGSWLSSRSLLAEMDQFGIGDALVAHAYAQQLDSTEGNQRTIQAAATSPRLHAVATIFPRFGPGADANLAAELDALTRAGCVAARLHPNPTHEIMDADIYARQYALTPAIAGPTLAALEERGLPVLLELAQTDWGELEWVCTAHPGLAVVVTNVSYTHKRSLYGLLDACPNLYCDTSCFHAYRGLEEVCELFGAGRLLFGTRLPYYNALAAKALVLFADLDDQARSAIAGGNLRGLIARSLNAGA
jgi:predicted TIM-barrel fold metal-dependent hydrolase